MKNAAAVLFSLIIVAFLPKAAFAVDCPIIYGGGPNPSCTPSGSGAVPAQSSPSLQVSKMVQTPGKGGDYVHNLGINDLHYAANQTIPFQIIIRNSGNTTLNNIQVVDTLPQYITFDSGAGSYDKKKNTVTIAIKSLSVGQSQMNIIVGKSTQSSSLPSGQGVVCVTNSVRVTSGTLNAQDSSQLCIDKNASTTMNTATKGGLPNPQVFQAPSIKTTPPTGPSDFVLPLLTATSAAGYVFKKKFH